MPYVHRKVVRGRLTVTQIKRTKEDGHHVEVKIYPGEDETEETVNEWIFPVAIIYDYDIAVATAMRQSFRNEKFTQEDFS